MMRSVPWTSGRWTNPPVSVHEGSGALVVEAVEGSDAWRHTSYGFVHASEHALLAPFGAEEAVEVDVVVDLSEQFDQVGVFVAADDERWVKAGVELSDGVPQVGAVVTWPCSDWSVAPVPQWLGQVVTVRVSRSGDALTVRAGVGGSLQLVRVLPVPVEAVLSAGPMLCAPTRAGFAARFTGWRVGPPDAALHP